MGAREKHFGPLVVCTDVEAPDQSTELSITDAKPKDYLALDLLVVHEKVELALVVETSMMPVLLASSVQTSTDGRLWVCLLLLNPIVC
jgi:hypothetical protein